MHTFKCVSRPIEWVKTEAGDATPASGAVHSEMVEECVEGMNAGEGFSTLAY